MIFHLRANKPRLHSILKTQIQIYLTFRVDWSTQIAEAPTAKAIANGTAVLMAFLFIRFFKTHIPK